MPHSNTNRSSPPGDPFLRTFLQVALPIVVLGLGALAVWTLWTQKPKAEPKERVQTYPRVRVMEAEPTDHDVRIESRGNVAARARIELVPEVGGKVIEVAPGLVEGGSFTEGEVLLRIDPTDYELAVVRQEAQVSRTEVALTQELAEAEIARREWQQLGTDEEPDALVLREPQVESARAEAKAAKAALRQAQINLERTELRAPFPGRVLEESVDVGQFVVAGTPLASLYSTDGFEVRLTVDDRSVSFLPFEVHELGHAGATPAVLLSASHGDERRTWRGYIARSAGQVDIRSRLITLIARIPAQPPEQIVEILVANDGSSTGAEAHSALPIERALRALDGVGQVDSHIASDETRIEVARTDNIVDESFALAVRNTVRSTLGGDTQEPIVRRAVRSGTPPPALGQFLHAEIDGVRLRGVFAVPRSVMMSANELLVVERSHPDYDSIVVRRVHVARSERDLLYIDRGLSAGDRIVTSRLEVVVDGMRVQVLGDEPEEPAQAPESAEAERPTKPAADGGTSGGTPPAVPPTEGSHR